MQIELERVAELVGLGLIGALVSLSELIVTEGPATPPGEVYFSIEGSKGELGLYLVSEGLGRAYRLRIRGPSFANMGCLKPMATGGLIADLVATVASLDPVLGEVDR